MSDIKTIRKKLEALRTKYGHDTPIGCRYGNLLLMLDRLPHYERPEWATYPCQHLPGLIGMQLASIEALRQR